MKRLQHSGLLLTLVSLPSAAKYDVLHYYAKFKNLIMCNLLLYAYKKVAVVVVVILTTSKGLFMPVLSSSLNDCLFGTGTF